MTKNTFSLVTRTSLPLILAQVAFAANTFVTQYFLARHSTTALTASLPASMLAVAYMVFFNMTLGYAGTIFAQRHGGGDRRSALTAFVQSVWLTLFTMPLLALGIPLARVILSAFHTPPAVLAAEMRYFDILMLNAAFTILAQVLGGFFTGQGKTRFVGCVTVFGFLVNMAIAPVFIAGCAGLPDGTAGAGIAQTVAHVVPCVILAVAIARTDEFRDLSVSLRPDLTAHETLEILRLGVPNGLRTVLEIGSFFLFTAFISECAPAAVAASTAVFAVNNIPYGCVQGLSPAVEILVGRATGRGDDAAVRGVITAASLIVIAIASVYAITLWLGQDMILDLFLKNDDISRSDFHAVTRVLVAIVAAKALFEMMTPVFQGALRGKGETVYVFLTQAASSFLFWIPAYVAVRIFHPSVPAYWMTMTGMSGLTCLILGVRVHRTMSRLFRATVNHP